MCRGICIRLEKRGSEIDLRMFVFGGFHVVGGKKKKKRIYRQKFNKSNSHITMKIKHPSQAAAAAATTPFNPPYNQSSLIKSAAFSATA